MPKKTHVIVIRCMVFLAYGLSGKDGIMAGKNGSQKLGKLVETGLSVAKIAQAKAEEALRDVAHISETQRNQMREIFEDTARKSRENTELLIKGLRKEMEKQLRSANAISKEEFGKFSERLSSLSQDLGKMSSIREDLSKLTEMMNSLIRQIPKMESTGEETKAKAAPANTAETVKPPAAAKPRRTTASRAVKVTKAKAETGGTTTSATPRSRSRATSSKSTTAPKPAGDDGGKTP